MKGTSGFWVAYQGSYGNTLSPTHAAVLLRVINSNDYPVRIETCSAEVSYKGNWYKTWRIPTGASHIPYFGFSQSALSKVDISGEDFQENAEQQIAARASVQGWVLFEFSANVEDDPHNIQNLIGNLRISVKDDYGATATIEAPQGEDSDGLHGVSLRLGPREDLSHFHLKFMYEK